MRNLGVVVIGRNEGQRLVRCLESLAGNEAYIVYVDSGSTDNSIIEARRLGAEVVELDGSSPFTAARARNQGVRHLLAHYPSVEFIQFVDGDCEVTDGWLGRGLSHLEGQPRVAVVCGRCRERYPEASVYNRLCDLEWDSPVGETDSCGGIALFRRTAFEAAGGFRDTLIAGEEPELCLRLRAADWKIMRLADEMVRHDAAMYSFRQWWRRALRGGHAFAECSSLHRSGFHRLWQRETRSTWLWACGIPLLILAATCSLGAWGLLGLAAYPLLVLKIWWQRKRRSPWRHAALYACFCVLAKFPQAMGQFGYYRNKWSRRPSQIIEYKGPERKRLA